jgi:hypothetical protein
LDEILEGRFKARFEIDGDKGPHGMPIRIYYKAFDRRLVRNFLRMSSAF